MGDIAKENIKELEHKIKEIIQNTAQSEGNRKYVKHLHSRKYAKYPLSRAFLSLYIPSLNNVDVKLFTGTKQLDRRPGRIATWRAGSEQGKGHPCWRRGDAVLTMRPQAG